MRTVIQDAASEIADNWPAFVYIAMSLVFSFFFFRQRRAEARMVRDIAEGIHENISARLDRIELLIRHYSEEPDLSGTDSDRAKVTFSS